MSGHPITVTCPKCGEIQHYTALCESRQVDTQALRDALDAVKKSEAGGQYTIAAHKAYAFLTAHGDALLARLTSDGDADTERLNYIERTFSGMTNRERYLPVQMIWGKGCNGRTLREACDKYRRIEKFIDSAAPAQPSEGEPR